MLSDSYRQTLKALAKKSIEHGLKHGQPLKLDLSTMPNELTIVAATFVTLQKQGQLRGCIGMLRAHRPLAEDIVENSHAAAFSDHRFKPLSQDELQEISIHISILSPQSQIPCNSEQELIQQLRPEIDGLILVEGSHRATFLPTVWQSLPNPVDFIRHLKNKAGLPLDDWSPNIQAYRYTTESF